LSSLGPLTFGEEGGEVFLGRTVNQNKEISDKTAQLIDEEVHIIVDRCYKQAKSILEEKIDILHIMASALMKYETIDSKQLTEIMAGKQPSPPEDWEPVHITPTPEQEDKKSSPTEKRETETIHKPESET
jgi:cell division protease FtsH